MLFGIQAAWLTDKLPEVDLAANPEYGLVVTAAVLFCLLLLWNFILKKRFAKYRHLSSSQGERYQQFFDNCPDALLVVEHDGSIVTANAHACTLFKVDDQDVLAKKISDFVAGTSRAGFGKQFKLCLSGKKMRCEGFIQACDGTEVPVVMNGSLQRINGKKMVQLYIRDNSVLREVEDQVRSLYNQLDQVAAEVEAKDKLVADETRRAREEFLAFANHQIRTPLDGIMGMAQLLSDTPLGIEQHNCIYSILNSSASLLNVLRSMSEAPEEISEETVLQAEFVNLHALCDALSSKYEPLAVHKGIDLRCGCQSNVPLRVVTDEKRLSQVLSTLLHNAIKFTEQGLVMLNIECRRKGDHDAELYFQVIDTGVGIEQVFQSSLFKKSAEGTENWYARRAESGLGLAASRQVVELMGGEIDLISTKGKGSTFYFSVTLPLELPQKVADAAEQPKPVTAPPAGTVNDALVLVVDDNKISQKVVAAMLRKAGHEVDAVENGKEALSQIRKKHYDIVLMDCQMPVMDGYEATSSIRSLSEPYRNLPVIALTAHSLKHELQACRNCGMDGHLVKPVDRQQLLDTVDKHVLRHRQENAPSFEAAS